MSHFMVRWQFNDASAKAMVGKPQDRTGPAKTLIEGFGGKLHNYYFAFGEYDGVAICEFPDNTSAAACSMTAASTGAFSRFETMTLLTAKGSGSRDAARARYQDWIQAPRLRNKITLAAFGRRPVLLLKQPTEGIPTLPSYTLLRGRPRGIRSPS